MAKKTTKLNPEDISCLEVRVINSFIQGKSDFIEEQVVSYASDFDFQISLQPGTGLVRTDLLVFVHTESYPEQEKCEGFCHIRIHYAVQNLEAMVETGDKAAVEVDVDLQVALAAITYSTARGLLIGRFHMTPLARFILPVIDPAYLVANPKARKS